MRVLALSPLLGLLLAGAAQAQGAGPTFGSQQHFTEQGGEAVYNGVCAGCHMPHGQGAVGAGAWPALAGDARLASSRYAILRVLQGRAGMPPFGAMLTDAQVAAVVGYIRTQFGNAYTPEPGAADVAADR